MTHAGPGQPPCGHRSVPHTGDLRVEAWAPTREECVAEAVRGMVASFAELPADASGTVRECVVSAEDDDRLLAGALEEIIYRMDAADELPSDVAVTPEPGGVRVRMRCTMCECSAVTQTGAVPKAVALHGLRLAQDSHGWACRVTLDV
ncbi:archease [Streptomyces sp. NPDC004629]|uniref:archease n=1 Tax=Streptomyces sp. NPDC004629 TaxID=3364705 RepID=UPI00369A5CE8